MPACWCIKSIGCIFDNADISCSLLCFRVSDIGLKGLSICVNRLLLFFNLVKLQAFMKNLWGVSGYYSICQNNVPVTPQRGFHIFFKRTYQTKPYLVPTGLMMKYGRMLLKWGLGNIIDPAGHYASDADWSWYVLFKKIWNPLEPWDLFGTYLWQPP